MATESHHIIYTSLYDIAYIITLCQVWKYQTVPNVNENNRKYYFKGSPEGSSDKKFRGSILCDVIEIS